MITIKLEDIDCHKDKLRNIILNMIYASSGNNTLMNQAVECKVWSMFSHAIREHRQLKELIYDNNYFV